MSRFYLLALQTGTLNVRPPAGLDGVTTTKYNRGQHNNDPPTPPPTPSPIRDAPTPTKAVADDRAYNDIPYPSPPPRHPIRHARIPTKAIAADERAYERTVRDRQSFAQQERSEQEAFLRERERQKALHQMFGKKVN